MKFLKQLKFKNPLRRVKRRLTGCCLLILLGMILLCGGGLGMLVYLTDPAGAQTLEDRPLEVLLLIDNSNSMFEKGGLGSDPNLLRIEAARLFITYLGVDSGGIVHRLGVIFFGGEAELVVPLTPLSDDDRRAELAHLIGDPPRMSWTNPAAALNLAKTTLAATNAASRPAVVLLTDGKPEWTTTPTAQERREAITALQELARQFAAAEVPLFIILLQNSATEADPEIEELYVSLWEEMAAATSLGRFYRARQSEELLDIYHDIVVTLTGRQTDGVVLWTQVRMKTVEPILVEPGLAQITFVIRKSNPDLKVEIARPTGQPVSTTEAGVQYGGRPGRSREEIWTIAAPQPGNWQVRLDGQGTVTVWKDFYPAIPTPTLSPSPTATFTRTPLPTLTTTPSPSPTATNTPSPTVTSSAPVPSPTTTPVPPPATPGFRPSRWLPVPLLLLVAGGGGWLWLRHRRARPLLTGSLRRVTAPDLTGTAIPARLDLDSLVRYEIKLGPEPDAYLHLPSVGDQPVPPVRLVARLDPEGWFGVSIIPEPAGPAAVPILINNNPISHQRSLRDGDVITLGPYRFRYENLRQRG